MDDQQRDEGPEGLTNAVSGEEAGGNPTVSGLTGGGTGTEIGEGYPEAGGAHGSGGGVLKRGDHSDTVGGISAGTVGGSIVGSGIPPKPTDDDGGEDAPSEGTH